MFVQCLYYASPVYNPCTIPPWTAYNFKYKFSTISVQWQYDFNLYDACTKRVQCVYYSIFAVTFRGFLRILWCMYYVYTMCILCLIYDYNTMLKRFTYHYRLSAIKTGLVWWSSVWQNIGKVSKGWEVEHYIGIWCPARG